MQLIARSDAVSAEERLNSTNARGPNQGTELIQAMSPEETQGAVIGRIESERSEDLKTMSLLGRTAWLQDKYGRVRRFSARRWDRAAGAGLRRASMIFCVGRPQTDWSERLFGSESNVDSEILAEDSAYVLLNQTAHNKLLPAWLAADVALAGWTRAFMLNDLDTARELAPIVAKEQPDWQPGVVPETGAPADRWKFQAALLIALHRQFQPTVRVNYRTELGSSGSW